MKRRNKLILVTLVAIVFTLVFLSSCGTETYTVTFAGEGVNIPSQTVNKGEHAIEPKNPVREGYKFKYWYLTDADTPYVFATLVTSDVTLNAYWEQDGGDEPIQHTVKFAGEGVNIPSQTVNDFDKAIEPKDPERQGFTFKYWYLTDENEAYDFDTAVTSDVTLNALWEVKEAVIYWNRGQYSEILIFGQSGDTAISRANYGVEVMFKLHVYSDSTGTPVVKVNDEVISADGEGWYSFVVEADEIRVTVEGLERDSTPITGVGTARDPYVLSTPANFKRFIDAVNNPDNTRYNSAYVALDSDLSFNGEKLDPIGLELNSTHFEGSFDGRGHVLSNFTMKGKDGFGGLFGYVVTGEVKNVRVENAVYDIDASYESNYIVGGIVAYNMGSDVFGCSFDGAINIPLQISGVNAFIGGIVGFAQGYSDTNSATVSYCEVNADITSNGIAPVLAVGGIAGSIYGTADSAPMLIYNCVYNGNLSGKVILAGGIVGYMREDTAIANCYTSGAYVIANVAGYCASGAFVGLSEHNTAITNSYSRATYSATPSAQAPSAMEGTLKGEFVGNYYPDGDKTDDGSVDGKEILILNSYILRNGQVFSKGKLDQAPTADFTDFSAVKALLKWNDSEWSYADNALKTVVKQDQDYQLSFNVTFDFDGRIVPFDGETLQSVEENALEMYIPLDWMYQGNGQNTFKAQDDSISYGLFLDAERTIRLPASMLLTCDITVYVGFADYSNVQAEYYVTDAYGEQAKLVLDDNGMLTMMYDGKIARYVYVYDGSKLLIKSAYFAYMFYKPQNSSSLITDFYALIEQNRLVIYDNLFFVDDDPLYAYKSNAVMGEWYDVNQSVYTFNLDGTGLKRDSDTLETLFDYTLDGNAVTIKISGVIYNATLSDDGRRIVSDGDLTLSLDKFDLFAGEWETDFNNPVTFEFDGMGKMHFANQEIPYTVENGVIVLANDKGSAVINEDGLIEITVDGNSYTLARAHSYRGMWYDSSYEYTVVLNGIGIDGYGTGYDSNGITFTYSAKKDEDVSPSDGDGYTIYWYLRMSLYGYGNYVKKYKGEELKYKGEEFLYMAIYYEQAGAIKDIFNLAYYDPFEGDWYGSDGITYSFNGLGAYDVNTFGDNVQWVLEGEVTVTEQEQSQTVRYYYDRDTRKATFTCNGVNYIVTVDGLGNASFTANGGESKALYAPDAYADIVLSGEGYSVSFNGKSKAGNGVAVVTNGNGKQSYKYVLDGINVALYLDDAVALTIQLDEQSGFMVMDDGSKQISLGMYSPMSGNVYLASNGLYVSIGRFNMASEAEGEIFGEQAYFLLQSQDQLAVYVNGELVYYIVQSLDDNNVGLYDAYSEFVAMLVKPDGISGKYTSADGSSFEFDGRSLVIGYYASVTYVDKDGKEHYYYYSQNDDKSYSVFALNRDGEYDEEIELYAVYSAQRDGAVEYVDENGVSLWITAVEAE